MVTLSQNIAFSFWTKHLSCTMAVKLFCSLKCNSKANTNFFFLVHEFTDRRFTLSVCVCVCVCARAKSLLSNLTLCDPVDCSSSGSSVHRFLQARILGGFPLPSPGFLGNPGIDLGSLTSPALADGFFTTEPPGKPQRWPPQFFYFTPLHFMGKSHAGVVSVKVWLKRYKILL